MSFTDTHTHLYLEQFNDDIDSVIENSISSNVNRLFLPAINSSYTESMFLLKERYPENIFLMSGLHPCYVEANFLDEIKHVEMIINENEIVAVGEIGIDLYWDKTNLEIQIESNKKNDYQSGELWKYTQLVGSALNGAVTHPGASKEEFCYADI